MQFTDHGCGTGENPSWYGSTAWVTDHERRDQWNEADGIGEVCLDGHARFVPDLNPPLAQRGPRRWFFF